MEWINDNFDKLAPLSLMYEYTASDTAKITKKVREFYFQNGQITSDSWFNLTKVRLIYTMKYINDYELRESDFKRLVQI